MPAVSRLPHQEAWLTQLKQQRLIAVIRAQELALGHQMANTLIQAGIQLIEVTWNSDGPAHLVAQLRERHPDRTIGVGTILSQGELAEAIAAGAQFAFCPHTHPSLIEWGESQHCPMIPGALSPTEIVTDWQAGASSVKIFPAQSLGPAYIRYLQGPLGHIPLIPTGGVNHENAPAFLEAGAIAVGVASCLFLPELMQAQDWPGLVTHIQTFRQRIQLTQTT